MLDGSVRGCFRRDSETCGSLQMILSCKLDIDNNYSGVFCTVEYRKSCANWSKNRNKINLMIQLEFIWCCIDRYVTFVVRTACGSLRSPFIITSPCCGRRDSLCWCFCPISQFWAGMAQKPTRRSSPTHFVSTCVSTRTSIVQLMIGSPDFITVFLSTEC